MAFGHGCFTRNNHAAVNGQRGRAGFKGSIKGENAAQTGLTSLTSGMK